MGGQVSIQRKAGLLIAAASLVAAAASVATAGTPAPPAWVLHGRYAPVIKPTDFVRVIDNRYFPLKPGTAFHYRGTRDGTAQTDDMVVTHRVKSVLGVRCTVVEDTVSEHGKAIERTFDWYAQDRLGNVWYMGENSLERKNGRFVRADDSWEAGVKGARPGIIVAADPRPGMVYRQEYYPPGGALDQARVLGMAGPMRVAAGTFPKVLATIEWSPVEPQLEKKYYGAGIGEIREEVVAGGHEQFQLVKVTRG
jgi:hypothetical protein